MRVVKARASIVLTCAIVSACGAELDRTEPTTPAAMVGAPSPTLAAVAPRSNAVDATPNAPAPIDTRTRVIADAPPPPRAHGRAIDLDLKGADIHDVLRLLADVGHVNIVVADDVRGSVTLRMKSVPWDEALDVIVRAKGLFAERDGNVIIVFAKAR